MNDKVDTKQAIIFSSKKLFAQRGYKATTVRAIAQDADIAFSAIAYHFKGKEGILLSIINGINEDIGPNTFAILDAQINTKEELEIRLKIFMNDILVLGIKNWETVKILLTESYELSKLQEVSSMSNYMLSTLTQFFKRAKKNKMIKKNISQDLLADHILSLLMDQILHWPAKKEIEKLDLTKKYNREKWVNATVDLLFHGSLHINP